MNFTSGIFSSKTLVSIILTHTAGKNYPSSLHLPTFFLKMIKPKLEQL